MPEKPQETGSEILARWELGAPQKCIDEFATFLEGLRELSAEWPHDFTKLSGPHDGAEKAKCKRCQIEKRLAAPRLRPVKKEKKIYGA